MTDTERQDVVSRIIIELRKLALFVAYRFMEMPNVDPEDVAGDAIADTLEFLVDRAVEMRHPDAEAELFTEGKRKLYTRLMTHRQKWYRDRLVLGEQDERSHGVMFVAVGERPLSPQQCAHYNDAIMRTADIIGKWLNATPTERRVLEAYAKHEDLRLRQAGELTGYSHENVRQCLKSLQRKAAARDYDLGRTLICAT